MPALDREEILQRAKDAFVEAGRGFVVLMYDRDEPRYGFLSELEELLGDYPESKRLLDSIAAALETYLPESEAVLVDFRGEAIFISIIRDSGSELVGEVTGEPSRGPSPRRPSPSHDEYSRRATLG